MALALLEEPTRPNHSLLAACLVKTIKMLKINQLLGVFLARPITKITPLQVDFSAKTTLNRPEVSLAKTTTTPNLLEVSLAKTTTTLKLLEDISV